MQPTETDAPPTGLGQGRVDAPPWVILAVGGVVGLLAFVFVIARIVGRLRAR